MVQVYGVFLSFKSTPIFPDGVDKAKTAETSGNEMLDVDPKPPGDPSESVEGHEQLIHDYRKE
jgi:hypothetical protein